MNKTILSEFLIFWKTKRILLLRGIETTNYQKTLIYLFQDMYNVL